jgi:peptide/nickel transport system substrate-binding protein
VSKPPFNSRKVRQAVAYALDKKKILKAVFWGLGETTNHQPFLKQSRFYVPVEERESDVARARQLLAEAGYPNGFKTEFFEYSMTQQLAGTEAAIGQLKEIGIQATMKVIDRAPYYSMMKKGEYDISLFASDERYDPDDAYYMFYHSGEIDKNNWSRYSNKELDALLEKGRTTEKWPDRAPIYQRIVEILSEDVPMLYLYKSVIGCAYRDYLKGYRKGFAMRYAWHGGGAKYWWMDK